MTIETLEEVVADIVTRLSDAASNRKSAMHVPAVASADAQVRTMVLRDFDREAMTLRFHSDARSPKIGAFERDPRCGVLFYDKEAKVQLRVRGTVRVERTGPIADKAWAESANFARRCYLAPEAPGTPEDAPFANLPDDVRDEEPSDERLDAEARENFCVLLIRIDEVDWLYLAHDGHRRARWGGASAQWLAV
ncbi:pyridoxamine 5'-phosphate oxidase family protein [Sphingomicrobium sp. XHP0235]|uniref:pyridoxamine 5'-phosphate oxidase family protein n=1 Tax=Sphingomicrobium aquimarinum TaxID=3133971 RepID=UPI0031FF3C6A